MAWLHCVLRGVLALAAYLGVLTLLVKYAHNTEMLLVLGSAVWVLRLWEREERRLRQWKWEHGKREPYPWEMGDL